jgi:nucleoside-diphosphate-sugar epimerase
MRIAITGGAGFVGHHLARNLVAGGHKVVLITRGSAHRAVGIPELARARLCPVGISDEARLAEAFAGCDGVAHCAGISREIGSQTYQRVHVEGTRNVVNAAKQARVKKILLLSFLRARASCGSPYHESKWEAEEIVRSSELDYTVIKAGVIYGKGDQMLDHLIHSLRTFPVFPLVGMTDQAVRPVAVEDVVRVIQASLVEGRLSRQTVAVAGPEELAFSEVVRRVARVVGRRPRMFRLPVSVHYLLAWVFERAMAVPLVTFSQVRMLSEGIAEPLPACDSVPGDLAPRLGFTVSQIRRGLPAAGSRARHTGPTASRCAKE